MEQVAESDAYLNLLVIAGRGWYGKGFFCSRPVLFEGFTMMGAGAAEVLLMLLMSAGGASADLATLLDPGDYFMQRGVEVRLDTMMELAAAENKDGSNQIAQLLALRVLGDD